MVRDSNDQMNRYEVCEKIGRGKYSDVYRAMRDQGQGQPDKPSVLKILKPGNASLRK